MRLTVYRWLPALVIAIAAGDANAATSAYSATAVTRDSPASGDKTCFVRQTFSAYKDRLEPNTLLNPVGPHLSNVAVLIDKTGAAYANVSEEKFPGSRQFFLIAGKRYSGPEDAPVLIDKAALASLARGEVFQYTWTDWPYNAGHDGADAFVGFQAAFDRCVSFFKG